MIWTSSIAVLDASFCLGCWTSYFPGIQFLSLSASWSFARPGLSVLSWWHCGPDHLHAIFPWVGFPGLLLILKWLTWELAGICILEGACFVYALWACMLVWERSCADKNWPYPPFPCQPVWMLPLCAFRGGEGVMLAMFGVRWKKPIASDTPVEVFKRSKTEESMQPVLGMIWCAWRLIVMVWVLFGVFFFNHFWSCT